MNVYKHAPNRYTFALLGPLQTTQLHTLQAARKQQCDVRATFA